MSNIKNENYLQIQGWMLNELKLKGNELLIYACIYGFSQAEKQRFTGSIQYLADWCNCTKQGVMKCLKSLEDKGLIVKEKIRYNTYCYFAMVNKVYQDDKQSLPLNDKQSLPNNIDINNKDNNKESKKEKTYDEILEQITNEDVKNTFHEFIKMRKFIKKPMTSFALQKMINKLRKLAETPDKAIAILEQSILNNWQDIYELKDNKNKTGNAFIGREYKAEDLNQLFDNLEEIKL